MATSTSAATLISTTAELKAYLSSIPPSTTLYLDLEGKSLSRNGTLTLITILLHPQGVLKVVDVLSLGKLAFMTTSKDGKSLKSIFEDPGIQKCFWDVRNDADALWAHYKVGVAGVVDVQLLENASRVGDKTHLSGLEKAIRFDLKLGFAERNRWTNSKNEIKNLMSADVFSIRPVATKTLKYCTNDVVHLPALHAFYLKRISSDWLAKANEQSSRRVDEAHAPTYEPHSPAKARGPWGSGTPQRGLDELEDYMMEHRANDMLGDDDDDGYNEEYDDNFPVSCRDIIDSSDYHYYYSD